MSRDDSVNNVLLLERICLKECGIEMSKYFRFPEGRYSLDAINAVAGAGYKTVFWSFGYADWNNQKQPDAEKAYDLIIKNTHPGEVILLHPTSDTNVNILPRLIDTWRDMGYRFGTLDDLCA
jgi:peptidoglycan-N-acetylmuramic acid deacetylase